jgi:hypothetical protein
MASTILTKEQFADYAVAFLLDKMIKGDEILPDHERLNELAKALKGKGAHTTMLYYFIDSEPILRNKYKATRKVFKSESKDGLTIGVTGNVKKEKDTKRTLKDLVKKSLKKVLAHKKRSGFPLSEERVEKIIERVMIEEGFVLEDKE